MQNKPLWHNCSNPRHSLTLSTKKSRSVWQNVFQLKAFSSLTQSLSLSLILWCLGVKSVDKRIEHTYMSYTIINIISTLTDARPGSVTTTRSVVVHCLCQFLATLVVFCCSFALHMIPAAFCSSTLCCERQLGKLTPRHQIHRDRDWARARLLKKPLIKIHSVTQIWTVL